MGTKQDLTGNRYGRLTVLSENGRKGGGVVWRCKCDCGNITDVRANHLKRGAVVSCGCYNSQVIRTHDLSKTKLYHTYQNMKYRCENEDSDEYKNYGSRGIRVLWNNFESFYEWSMANGYKDGLTIDRIDVNGDYSPTNCRWATMKQQCRNRRTNVIIEYLGEKHCLSEWAEITNQPYARLQSRYRRGWSDREIILGR